MLTWVVVSASCLVVTYLACRYVFIPWFVKSLAVEYLNNQKAVNSSSLWLLAQVRDIHKKKAVIDSPDGKHVRLNVYDTPEFTLEQARILAFQINGLCDRLSKLAPSKPTKPDTKKLRVVSSVR